MKAGRTDTFQVTREEWFAEGVIGRYLVDTDAAGRWYEVSYCPMNFTTRRRVQIEHTDMHEKAIAAIQWDAEKRRRESQP